MEDNNSAVETLSREKATSDPGSIGAPMSGVVVEVRVKEGQEIKKGDPVCGKWNTPGWTLFDVLNKILPLVLSAMKVNIFRSLFVCLQILTLYDRWNQPLQHPFLVTSSALWSTKVCLDNAQVFIPTLTNPRRRLHQPGRLDCGNCTLMILPDLNTSPSTSLSIQPRRKICTDST